MRGMIGLVSILVVVFIIVFMFSDYMKQTKPAMKQATNSANQLAGRSSAGIGQAGTPVLQDSKFAPIERNGRLKALQVVAMPTTNGLYEYFGLIPGDVILEIGEFKVGDDAAMPDFESARDWVQEGMQRQKKMVVERGGHRITLPDQKDFVAPPAAPSSGSQNQ
jgi:hypothetical protein